MPTLTVTTLDDEAYGGSETVATPDGNGLSLREAIGLAAVGDTITFQSSGTVKLGVGGDGTGHLLIAKDLTIDGDLNGDNKADIIIDANTDGDINTVESSVFQILGGTSTLDSLVITGGNPGTGPEQGGGLYISSGSTAVTVANSTIINNMAGSGAGIYVDSTNLTVTDSLITQNTGTDVGGIAHRGNGGGELSVINSTVSQNVGTFGGLQTGFGTASLTNSTFTGNISTGPAGFSAGAGEIDSNSTALTVTNTIIASVGSAGNFIHATSTTTDHVTSGSVTFTGTNLLSNALIGNAPVTNSPTPNADLTQIFANTTVSSGVTGGTLADNSNTTQSALILAGGTADVANSIADIGAQRAFNAPSLNVEDSALAVDESGLLYYAPAATLSDSEGDAEWNGGTLKVQITGNAESTDSLSLLDSDGDGVSLDLGASTLSANNVVVASINSFGANGGDAFTLTFNDQATNAIVQETLQSMRFSPNSNNPSTDTRTITITATDKNGATSTDTRSIAVNAINDAPSNAGDLPFNASANMATASRIDFSNMRVVDGDSGNENVTFTFTASIGTITATMDSAATEYNVTVGGSGTVTVTITGKIADIDRYFNETANGDWFLYTGPAGVSGTDAARITVTANDGGNTGTGGGTDTPMGSFDIDIVIPNSLPTSENTSVAATEDQEYVFKEADFKFADTDAGATLSRVNISEITLAAGDKLVYREPGESDVDVTDGYNIYPSDLSDGYLIYIPQSDANGNARSAFDFTVRDNDGGVSTSSYTLSINVADVAEPDTGGSGSTNSGSTGSESSGDSSTSGSSSGITTPVDPVTTGSATTDTLEGSAGNDTIDGGSGGDVLRGGEGDDSVVGGNGDDEIFAGAGDTGTDTLQGNRGSDVIGGGAGDDLIVGGDISDDLDLKNLIRAGSDTLFGGAGDDFIVGGSFDTKTKTVANTGEGENFIWAGTGDDTVYGDDQNDKLGGGEGSDLINAGAGNDILYGGRGGADVPNDDTLNGGDGGDQVFASVGEDSIVGGNGNDTLFAGSGDDIVDGGADNDEIWGGSGDDALTGGDGDDTFSFITGFGTDTITDFGNTSLDKDTLDLSGIEGLTLATLKANATFSDGNTNLAVGEHGTLILEGITEAELDAIFDAGQVLVS